MTKEKGGDALNPNVDGKKFPKLAKATELANNYKIRAEKAEAESKKLKAKVEVKPSKKLDKKEGFDYAELAYLEAKGYSKKKEQDYVAKVMEDTGKSLREVLDNKYFQAEIKEMREHADTAEATPKGTKRSTQTARDKVEYWLNKGEMPPADQPELRREYVNARQKAETSGSKFAKHPVVE